MQPRLNPQELAPEGLKPLFALEAYLHRTNLEKPLFLLIKLRASQMNGCAYCIDMHSKDARAAGETEQRLYCLSAWRECPFYTDRERAALEWTEAVTRVADTHVPADVFDPRPPRPRRRLRPRPPALRRQGPRRPELRRRRHQRLEPDRHPLPHSPRGLP